MERKRLLFSSPTDSTGSCARCLTAKLDPARHRHQQYARRRQELPTRQGRVSHRCSPPSVAGFNSNDRGKKSGGKQRNNKNTLKLSTWTLRWLDLDLPCGEYNTLLSRRPPLLSPPPLSVKIPHRCCCCIRLVSPVFVSCADDFRRESERWWSRGGKRAAHLRRLSTVGRVGCEMGRYFCA